MSFCFDLLAIASKSGAGLNFCATFKVVSKFSKFGFVKNKVLVNILRKLVKFTRQTVKISVRKSSLQLI